MIFSTIIALASAALSAAHSDLDRRNDTIPLPKHYAVTLFPSFDSLDVIGPLNPLWYLSFQTQLTLSLLSTSLSPVFVEPVLPSFNTQNSSFSLSLNPTHTYAAPPDDIDVLIVPGGPGATFGNVDEVVKFVREWAPKVQYLLVICTGGAIAARAGVLDGKIATTNKKAWKQVTALGPNVDWKTPARWVVDGNVWSSSGVSAGQDMIFSFMEEIYGETATTEVQTTVEFDRVHTACDDPFSAINGIEPTWECGESRRIVR